MGWSLGHDSNWNRDIGYGVPAYCDHEGCGKEIDRGLARVCGGEPYGGELGCGLHFCGDHLFWWGSKLQKDRGAFVCARCYDFLTAIEEAELDETKENPKFNPFKPSPEHPHWVLHKLTDASWAEWRKNHPDEVQKLEALCATYSPEVIAEYQRVAQEYR